MKPIIFNTEMVKAVLEGRKTQTRRVIKPQPTDAGLEFATACGGEFYAWQDGGLTLDEHSESGGPCQRLCPYGIKDDRLWVRETFCEHSTGGVVYRADEEPHEGVYIYHSWCPSIHMPRWASRITLEITNVRVERVQDISEEDAIAEGIRVYYGDHIVANKQLVKIGAELLDKPYPVGYHNYLFKDDKRSKYGNAQEEMVSWPIESFITLWNSSHAWRGYGWDMNPFCWVVEFKVSNE